MRDTCRNVAVLAAMTGLALFTANAASPFSGRWDLTVVTSAGTYPSWLEIAWLEIAWPEIAGEAESPAVRIVGRTGSVHLVRAAKVEGKKLTFEDGPAQWKLTIQDHRLTGKVSGGLVSGVPAPRLVHKAVGAWTNTQALFNGHDLAGWEPDNPAANHWMAENGELENLAAGANIRTTRKFGDFKLHIEYNCPPGGNSGVYLRGRYEVQVEYEPADKNDAFHSMGSIYGFIRPATAVEPRPGRWESYDVTLVGRKVTVIRDGILIIDKIEIPGITGGALDSHESEPGPIYLQGDHTGGLKYRNITISVPQG